MLRIVLLTCLSVLFAPDTAAQPSPLLDQPDAIELSDRDTRVAVTLRMAQDAQAYYLKPTDFGGGDGSFDGISMEAIQYWADDTGRYVRSFQMGTRHAYTLVESDGVVTITAASDQSEAVVQVVVTGPELSDITLYRQAGSH